MTIHRGPWGPAFIKSSGGAAPSPPASTLFWWTFDETGGALPYFLIGAGPDYPVEQINGQNGRAAAQAGGPCQIDAGGQFTNKLQVSGGPPGAWITFPQTAMNFPPGLTEMTIDFWYNELAAFGGLVQIQDFGTTNDALEIGLSPNGGVATNADVRVDVRDTDAALQTIVENNVVDANAPGWHNFRLLLTNALISVYIDGNFVVSLAPTQTLDILNSPASDYSVRIDAVTPGILEIDNLAIFDGAFPVVPLGAVPTLPYQWPGIS